MAEELHVAKGHLKNAIFGNERKRYRKDHRAKSGTGTHLSNPEGVIPILCGASISWNKKRSDCSSRTGSWKKDKEKQASLKHTLQELRQETAPRQLGKEEKQKAAIR